jgi:nucleotide-binding universal stress UspA family protein
MANEQPTRSSTDPASFSMGKDTAALGEIVVFIDARSESTNTLKFAATLAQEYSARLISVFMQPEPTVTPAETFARGKGMQSISEVHQAQLERIEGDYRAQFEDAVRRHGIRSGSEWRSLPYLSSEVGVHAYYADMVVIARPTSAGPTASLPGLAESLVMSSGRPIIVFPPGRTVSRVNRILVAWNATRESIRAVADALPLLVKAKAVEVLVVDHQRRQQGHGQEPGADIARHLARHGAQVEVRRMSSDGKDVGGLLLSQAAAFSADLLVMGAYGHTHLREWIFGSVTRTILYEASLPVLMSR